MSHLRAVHRPSPLLSSYTSRDRLVPFDHAVGVLCGVVTTLALGTWGRVAGEGTLAPEVAVALFGAVGGLGMQASFTLRAWRWRQRLQPDDGEDVIGISCPPEGLESARKLTETFRRYFPSSWALWVAADTIENVSDSTVIRYADLELLGWEPWALALASRVPHLTCVQVHTVFGDDPDPHTAFVFNGYLVDLPVVGASLGGAQDHALTGIIGRPRRIRVGIEIPPHSVVLLRAFLTRPPGDHDEPKWVVEPAVVVEPTDGEE